MVTVTGYRHWFSSMAIVTGFHPWLLSMLTFTCCRHWLSVADGCRCGKGPRKHVITRIRSIIQRSSPLCTFFLFLSFLFFGTPLRRSAFWLSQLGKKKFVDVREFKGMVLIDIREYYENSEGEMKPGKKGISLNPAQWKVRKCHTV